jgi:hypothetical protein
VARCTTKLIKEFLPASKRNSPFRESRKITYTVQQQQQESSAPLLHREMKEPSNYQGALRREAIDIARVLIPAVFPLNLGPSACTNFLGVRNLISSHH